MNGIESIASVMPDVVAGGVSPMSGLGAQVSTASGFAQWLSQEVQSTNGSLLRAEAGVRDVALGESGDLHGVMIHLEEARLQFQLLSQVRSRALEAYQDILRMQV